MGLKRRNFTSTLRSAVLETLQSRPGLSKRDLLAAIRDLPTIAVSVRRLTATLAALLDEGRVRMSGSRATARFAPAA